MWAAFSLLFIAAPGQTLALSELPDDGHLAALVWQHAPELQASRARIVAARAEAERSRLLPEPSLELSADTIPIGPTNPPGIAQPLLNVPSLGAGLSVLLEVGKRGPRQDAAREAARASALAALDEVRLRTLEVLEAIGDIASAQLRVATLERLAEDAARLTQLQRARADKGDASSLDADRAQLEAEGAWTDLADARESVAEGLRQCSQRLGLACAPFAADDDAARFLGRHFTGPDDVASRPDVKALEAAEAGARAERTLAARRALPDPTLTVGYTWDSFAIGGAQAHSLSAGLSIPLPLFDRGGPGTRTAEAAATAARVAREGHLAVTAAQLERLAAQAATVAARRERLTGQSLPLAESVVSRLETAVTRGAADLQELLLARHARSELLLALNDVHRAAFRLEVERARLTGAFPLPQELTDVP